MKPIQLRALRNSHNLTQSQAAQLLFVTLRAYQHWEAGDRAMSDGMSELFIRKLDACPHCSHLYTGDRT